MKKLLAILFPVLPGCAILAQTSTATVYTTADKTQLRLTQEGRLNFTDSRQPLETEPFILVDPQSSFQTILGFGGALTDASAETFAKLPKTQQAALLAYIRDFWIMMAVTLVTIPLLLLVRMPRRQAAAAAASGDMPH